MNAEIKIEALFGSLEGWALINIPQGMFTQWESHEKVEIGVVLSGELDLLIENNRK